MPMLHSFLGVYSLRTGSAVGLIMSLGSIVIYVLVGIFDVKEVFNARVIILYLMWISFAILALVGVHQQNPTFLIPELSRRILFIVLDIMSVIASIFKEYVYKDVAIPDIGLQFYTVANAHPSLYAFLIAIFILTIPLKVYLFLILVSYYIQLKLDESVRESPQSDWITINLDNRSLNVS